MQPRSLPRKSNSEQLALDTAGQLYGTSAFASLPTQLPSSLGRES